jgi:hypothetical protein
MKRTFIVIALLLGSVAAAQADRDIFVNTLRKPRGDAQRQSDFDYCVRTAGPNVDGRPTPARFKRCMASRGWRYVRTIRTARTRYYTDPNQPGLRCHDIVVFGVVGSSCSNF